MLDSQLLFQRSVDVAEGSWRCVSRALDESVFGRQYPQFWGRLRGFCQRPFLTAGRFTDAVWVQVRICTGRCDRRGLGDMPFPAEGHEPPWARERNGFTAKRLNSEAQGCFNVSLANVEATLGDVPHNNLTPKALHNKESRHALTVGASIV